MNVLRTCGLLAVLLLLIAGCAGGGEDEAMPATGDTGAESGTTDERSTTGETRAETTAEGTTAGETVETVGVQLEQLASGAQGPKRRGIFVASSARELAAATGLQVPDAGEGTYLAALWGQKNTGGYTVDFGSASAEGDRVTVVIDLGRPPPDAIVAQVLTYPYAVAVLRGADLAGKELVFVTQGGREIRWPVRSV